MPIETQTPGRLDAELVRKKILTGEFDIQAHEFLAILLVERWEELGTVFQDFLQDHQLSSHQWLVARKV